MFSGISEEKHNRIYNNSYEVKIQYNISSKFKLKKINSLINQFKGHIYHKYIFYSDEESILRPWIAKPAITVKSKKNIINEHCTIEFPDWMSAERFKKKIENIRWISINQWW